MSAGRFVSLEGIDGAGKTTAVAALGGILRRQGYSVTVLDKHTLTFGSPYVAQQMDKLRAMIWGHPADDPYLELGDWHWVHLQVAWYAAVEHCVVRPLIDAGHVILTDTWANKFLAKLAMRPSVDLDRARTVFTGLIRPDLVIALDLEPATAATRRETFAASESGNHEGTVDRTAAAFTAYQTKLAVVLAEFARRDGWRSLDVNGLSVQATATALAEMVAEALRPEPVR